MIRTLFCTLLCIVGLCSRAAAERPNIVILLADDAGYNEFSMHGAKQWPTPRIDSIAQNGVRFTNGYVSGTVCSPTRAGLLTGRYQNLFGHEFNIPPVYSEENGLSLSESTIADALRAGGYRTIALGKWHLGYAPKFHPMERGFTDYFGFLQGARSFFPLDPPTQLNQLLRDREPVRPEKFEYMTDELAEAAVDYIHDTKDAPLFMYVAFNATHTPIHALESDIEAAEKISPKNAKLRAMTMALDRAVGTILDGLKSAGKLDNTLVIFVNDNGGAAGHDNAPLRGHKGTTWEGGMRVPFAMQWPSKLQGGIEYHHPVIALDLYPTAVAAAGLEVPQGKMLDGVDLLPYVGMKLEGRPHQTLYWKNGAKWAVRDGDLKLVVGNVDQSGNTPALYDLSLDLSETKDLAAEQPAEVQRLVALYQQWKSKHVETPWGRGNEGGDEDTESTQRPRKKKANGK